MSAVTQAPAWVVLENPGTEAEVVISEHPTQHLARRDMDAREGHFDMVKRLPDGTLRHRAGRPLNPNPITYPKANR